MTAPLTLYLVRHGDVHNPDKILYGRMPNFRLSELGRDQATAAGNALVERDISAIYASPQQRAQETAAIIANAIQGDIAPKTDERLNEVYSPFDGTSQAEMDKIFFDLYTDVDPPYEQPRDLRRRLLDFINTMRETHAGQSIVGVTHGDIVVTAFMYTTGADENDIGRTKHDTDRTRLLQLGLPEPYPSTASLSRLTYSTDDPDEVPQYEYINPHGDESSGLPTGE